MLYSRLLLPTLKEDPADSEVASHRLMVRSGMIRQVARGIYDFLPLGRRTLHKVEAIVREELNRAGCQEVLLPVVCPAELWQESGRWDLYGKELLRIRDRNDREFCLGPTHEEVMTDLVRRDVRSYRELPLNLYQIQTKFRDEIRPRFGLMRGREFVMKDGYSFHATYEDTLREYENMRQAYSRIFRRCGLRFRAVEADTGNIGGSLSHEFQVLAESGEDLIVSCSKCEYAANVEKAENRPVPAQPLPDAALSEVPTPGARTIEEVSAFLSRPPEHFIKTLILMADEQGIAVLLRGDDQLSEPKLKAMLGATVLRMAEPAEVERLTGAPQGFAGPVGLKLPMYADYRLSGCRGMVSGANKNDTHVVGVSNERDFSGVTFANLRTAAAGDACARCEDGVFEEHRGIEVGHVFYLGKKYSQKLGATYLDDQGNAQVMEMGTYGIGVTRTMAAAVEQHHDDKGIRWPISLAPFEVVIVAVKWDDEPSRVAATSLHDALQAAGVEVLLDDRDERAGVKFNDADLIGIPFRITIGPRGLKEGKVELKERSQAQAQELTLEGAAADVIERVRRAHAELRQ
ncbi:MAG TPA: proline--tRNA ligase [Candidatus Limnocylindrales bacterium]|nr:proline--tRNA ligase [Candidatus Limnocylindrales bacterium]